MASASGDLELIRYLVEDVTAHQVLMRNLHF